MGVIAGFLPISVEMEEAMVEAIAEATKLAPRE